MHPLPGGSCERRASAYVSHSVGSVMTRKFYSIFFKKSRGPVGSAPGRLPQKAKSLIPKISSARGSKMPAGILRRGRIARASPMKKVRSMRAFFINERAANYRLRSHWNYVGRHGADGTHFLSLVDCPVDSRATAECFRCLFRDGRFCFAIRSAVSKTT